MGAAAIPAMVAISAASAGYGIYASERARAASQRAASDAAAQQQKYAQEQAQQLQQQQQAALDLAAQQSQQQSQTLADIKAQQAAAIQQEQAAIPGIQDQLNQSLIAQNRQAVTDYQPLLEQRLNALGLLQSGALPAQQAKYTAGLDSQRQAALANYAIQAQQQIQGQQAANVGTDVNLQQQNLIQNLQTGQQNLAQQYANQNIANQNNLAYQQYVNSLQAAQNQAAQQAAGAYLNFGGQIGSGLIGYYGQQGKTQTPTPQYGSLSQSYTNTINPGLQALSQSRGFAPYDPYSGSSGFGY